MSNPFQSWTEADVAAFNRRAHTRITKNHLVGLSDEDEQAEMEDMEDGSFPESELHNQILAECRRRAWIAFHGAMSQRTARVLGEPDFHILADNGRQFLIEVKTARGKLSPTQLAIKCWAEKLGHTVHVVRSFEQFLQIVA